MPEGLKIFGFTEDPSSNKAKGGGKTFSTRISPSKVRHSRSLAFNENNVANSTAKDVKQYQGYEQDRLDFELLFDSTTLITEDQTSVQDLVRELQDVVYTYDGSIHKPLYLVVNWSSFGFKGHLKEMSVEYNLFNTKGEPIRAKVMLSFVGHEDFEAAQKNANNQSPDMSHVKTIRQDDAIPLLCEEIYDDMGYYVHIAELNGLTNFRNVPVGTQLIFPPLES